MKKRPKDCFCPILSSLEKVVFFPPTLIGKSTFCSAQKQNGKKKGGGGIFEIFEIGLTFLFLGESKRYWQVRPYRLGAKNDPAISFEFWWPRKKLGQKIRHQKHAPPRSILANGHVRKKFKIRITFLFRRV